MPRINPPPPAIAELTNQCTQLNGMSAKSFSERDFDPKISYWIELKQQYLKDNPDVVALDNYPARRMVNKPLKISEEAAVQMPMKTVASLIAMVAIGTWTYFGLHETLNNHSTQIQVDAKRFRSKHRV